MNNSLSLVWKKVKEESKKTNGGEKRITIERN